MTEEAVVKIDMKKFTVRTGDEVLINPAQVVHVTSDVAGWCNVYLGGLPAVHPLVFLMGVFGLPAYNVVVVAGSLDDVMKQLNS